MLVTRDPWAVQQVATLQGADYCITLIQDGELKKKILSVMLPCLVAF